MKPVEIARLFLFVREAGQNHGQRVEAIQRWCGGQPGESWCAYFATMVLDLAYGGEAPIRRQGVVQEIRDLATENGWITATPSMGDLFLYIDANDHAHHIGFVTGTEPLTGIAGNTDEHGTSSNGDRVAEHGITAKVFIHLPEAP
jgi:hypothetical protein